jgi:hypothetical protein
MTYRPWRSDEEKKKGSLSLEHLNVYLINFNAIYGFNTKGLSFFLSYASYNTCSSETILSI